MPGNAPVAARVSLGIRPERLRILPGREKSPLTLEGKLADKVFFGEVTHFTVEVKPGEPALTVAATNVEGPDDLAIGSRVRLGLDPQALVLLG